MSNGERNTGIMKRPPSIIYLQYYGSGDPERGAEIDENDVTWCVDKIFDHDFKYRLVSQKRKKAKK